MDDNLKLIEEIYEKYRSLMYFKAFDMLHSQSDTEDAIQEALLTAMRFIDRIDQPDSRRTKSFILMIVESKALDIMRRRRRILPLNEEINFENRDIHDLSAEKDALALAIASLNFDMRRVLLLKYDMGLSYDEIASITGKSLFSVYKTAQRAKKQLAAALEKEGCEIL